MFEKESSTVSKITALKLNQIIDTTIYFYSVSWTNG